MVTSRLPGRDPAATAAHDGSTASASVTPTASTVDGLVTVIRQKAVDPTDTDAHGPAPAGVAVAV